jgi:hypothetical protein
LEVFLNPIIMFEEYPLIHSHDFSEIFKYMLYSIFEEFAYLYLSSLFITL